MYKLVISKNAEGTLCLVLAEGLCALKVVGARVRGVTPNHMTEPEPPQGNNKRSSNTNMDLMEMLNTIALTLGLITVSEMSHQSL